MSHTPAPADLDARKRALLGEFRRFLPAASVLHTEEALKPYECDGLTAYRQVPLVAVLPETVEQVQQAMRACSRLGVPVVARGAGTGLSGGALPLAGGVLLSLAKLNRILEVDAVNRVARVQPGVRNLAISEHVAPLGLYYAPDPSSQIACSIGGNVAENAGGLHCLKYGLTVHNVLELGGTITGEHGVGVEKIDQMCVQFASPELAQFHAVKGAFDPRGLLNPGKAVPTLQRCAEFGAMHVHGGRLPFAEIERF